MSEIVRLPEEEEREFIPTVLPVGWQKVRSLMVDNSWQSDDGLRVILTVDIQRDEKRWIHVSFSRADKIPSYEDVRRAKELFIGKNRLAVQVFPSEDRHVNFHPYCLHLWSCIDGDPVPDFRKGNLI